MRASASQAWPRNEAQLSRAAIRTRLLMFGLSRPDNVMYAASWSRQSRAPTRYGK